jgi:TfoX/Sxy family transcriptional regulator of competence genes
MFGEYGVYLGDQFVALICDDTLFIKPTAAGQEFGDQAWLAEPYPNAKPHYGIPADRIEDAAWLQEFLEATAALLPPAKPKRPQKPSASS